MSADLQIDNRCVAKLDVRSIQGRQGLGFHELRFTIDINISEHEIGKERNFKFFEAELSIQNKQPNRIGLLQSHAKDNQFVSHDYSKNEYFSLTIELDASRLQAIEEQRQGNGLTFILNIHYSASENGQKWHPGVQQLELKYSAEQSEWLKVLKDMGYQETMLLEIPMPDDQAPPYLAEAIERLQQSQDHLLKGYNREAIGYCRDVIERINRLPDQKKLLDELNGKIQKKLLDKQKRYVEVRKALYSLVSAARHDDEITDFFDWSPEDARSIIIITAALLRTLVLNEYGDNK